MPLYKKNKEVQLNYPTDQVPDLRDTIDCRADNAMKTAPNTISTLPQYHSYEPCTVCRVGGEGDRAGPLPCLPLISPMSVISSSTLEEPIPPSATTLGGAPKSSKTNSHQFVCGFSSNNSAQPQYQWSPSRSQTPVDIPDAALYKVRWGIVAGLRLRGGGETATATSGWNNNNTNNSTTPYSQQNNSSAPPSQTPTQWNNNNANTQPPQPPAPAGNTGLKPNNSTASSQAPATSQPQTAQASQPTVNNSQPQTNGQASGQPAATQNGNSGGNGGSTWAQAAGKGLPAATPSAPTSASTKQQLEQLNNMREALFSQDGWGAHVNQDSGWDIPSSPEPGQKDSNGAAVPQVWKPNVNNGTDLWETTLRNGGQPPPRVEKTTPWGSHTPASNIGGTWGVDDDVGDNMWNPPQSQQWPSGPNQPQPPLWAGGGGPKKEPEWSGSSGTNWGDMRGAVGGAADPRDMARGGTMMEQRDSMRNVMDQHRGMVGGDMMMRGDPRGISGRLNGAASEGMWPQQPPHHMPPAKPGVWPGGPPPKDKPNGWEEPSPPQQRRNIPNFDDGTSLWGTQQQRLGPAALQVAGQSKVSHWKDLPSAGMGRGMPQGMPQNRMAPNDIRANNPLWGHPASYNGPNRHDMPLYRNGSWDGPHEMPGSAPWPEEKVGVNSWNDPSMLNAKYKMGWDGEVPNTWDHPPKQPQKMGNKDMIWGSKPFRVLSEMGFKKEEVENALRNCNMNMDDALELLTMSGGGPNWRGRHSDLEPPFDHSGFPSQRFNPQQLPFAPPGSSANGPNSSSQTLSPALVQKIMTQQPPPQQAPSQPPAPYTQIARAQQPNQPSAHQLRVLVNQIQLAVHAGYLNQQILNQPLAPQTLILLNQLLQHIKVLQNLTNQQQLLQMPSNALNKANSSQALLHVAVQMTKTKQTITNLQNQIQAQQALYVKQQQQPQISSQQGDFFKNPPVHDPLSALPSNFSDLSINKDPQQHSSAFQSQQSRLTQWKLPSLDKDSDLDFSRAPGTTTKPSGGNSSPNLNSVLGQADGTWSRSNSEGGWPDTSMGDDNKEWPNTSQANSQAFTDLVPEFEPGKPWKGTQMKSIEDDPSITPGSVVRSPLSLAATIKDTDIFSSGGKTSPTSSGTDMVAPLGLGSSTWTFNPQSSTASSSFTSPLGKLSGGKNTWAEAPPVGNELWGAPNKPRGPPPGLSSKAPTTNGWGSHWGAGPQASSWALNSTWLLLRNLTPQIDGSTLKTLCLQHGPVQKFHLYLNQAICLAKYNTREEAVKAQNALNNCVLGNTTIYSEMLSESDVQSVLQHLTQQSGSGGGWGRGGGKVADTWGTGGWPPSNTGGTSLWSPDPPQDPHRSTPSSLFLPGDLLGPGDSM